MRINMNIPIVSCFYGRSWCRTKYERTECGEIRAPPFCVLSERGAQEAISRVVWDRTIRTRTRKCAPHTYSSTSSFVCPCLCVCVFCVCVCFVAVGRSTRPGHLENVLFYTCRFLWLCGRSSIFMAVSPRFFVVAAADQSLRSLTPAGAICRCCVPDVWGPLLRGGA